MVEHKGSVIGTGVGTKHPGSREFSCVRPGPRMRSERVVSSRLRLRIFILAAKRRWGRRRGPQRAALQGWRPPSAQHPCVRGHAQLFPSEAGERELAARLGLEGAEPPLTGARGTLDSRRGRGRSPEERTRPRRGCEGRRAGVASEGRGGAAGVPGPGKGGASEDRGGRAASHDGGRSELPGRGGAARGPVAGLPCLGRAPTHRGGAPPGRGRGPS